MMSYWSRLTETSVRLLLTGRHMFTVTNNTKGALVQRETITHTLVLW